MKLMTMSSAVSPLYLFGYGSLLWRPGDLLGSFQSYLCTAYNWKRLFVQRSMDHRGFPEYPGLVATIIHDNDLEKVLNIKNGNLEWVIPCVDHSNTTKNSECIGLVWHIPPESRDQVLEELDYREKGGYTRHSIKVRMHQQTSHHIVDELVEAIVYTGSIDNPLFDFKPLNLGSSHYIENLIKKPSLSIRPRNPGASIIAASKGPSGSNIEYLFGLVKFIKETGLCDEYLDNLCYDVLLRVGTWRARQIRHQFSFFTQTSSVYDLPTPSCCNRIFERQSQMVGWGSNEFQQIVSLKSKSADTLNELSATVDDIDLLIKSPAVINHASYPSGEGGHGPIHTVHSFSLLSNSTIVAFRNNSCILSHSTDTSETETEGCNWYRCRLGDDCDSVSDHCSITDSNTNILNEQVIAGGRWSGQLVNSKLKLWGTGLETAFDIQSAAALVGTDEEQASTSCVVEVDGVAGCAIGHNHILILSCSGQVLGLGDNSCGQCVGAVPLPFQLSQEIDCESSERVLKLSAGLKHSAAITNCGKLYTWGQSLHGQSLDNIYSSKNELRVDVPVNAPFKSWISQLKSHGVGMWDPLSASHAARLIDVSTGAKHTCCVDDLGNVWSFGSNKFGALGRETKDDVHSRQPTQVDMSAFLKGSGGGGDGGDGGGGGVNVRWLRVTSGWHHTVARGISTDGDHVTVGFGRCDMHQFPCRIDAAEKAVNDLHDTNTVGGKTLIRHINLPRELSALPNGAEIVEVWCGSEFTLAADDAGLLWACGWNEHFNLGLKVGADHSNANDVVSEWRPVLDSSASAAATSSSVVAAVSNSASASVNAVAQQLRVSVLWEGALAAGGGHVICLV